MCSCVTKFESEVFFLAARPRFFFPRGLGKKNVLRVKRRFGVPRFLGFFPSWLGLVLGMLPSALGKTPRRLGKESLNARFVS